MRKIKLIILAIISVTVFVQFKIVAQILIKQAGNDPTSLNGMPMPKAVGSVGTIADLSNPFKKVDINVAASEKTMSGNLVCSQPNPAPKFDFSPGKTINCNTSCVSLDVRDSAWTPGALGEWMEHAALIVFQTDAFNDAQDIFELWTGGNLLLRVGASNTGAAACNLPNCSYYTWAGWFGSNMNSRTARVWLYNICPGTVVEYKLFDSGNNANVPYYVWDPATNTVKGSGFFTGAGGSTGTTYTNWGGIATWSCPTCPPGSFSQQCSGSFGQFCPTAAKVGKYGITYTWDNTIGCTNTFTDTIEVLPIYTTTWTPPASLCETSASVNLNTYLGGLTTPGGTWSGSGVTGSNWSTTGLSGPITLTYTVGAGTSCESKESHVITINPKPVIAASTTTPTFCANTAVSAILTATGAPTLSWSPGGGSGSPITVNPTSTTTYTVTGTSAANCTSSSTVTVTINPAPSATAASVDVKCKGAGNGSITITPSPGTPPYTFAWSGGQTSQNLVSLAGGNYAVTVTDNKGCTATTSATINEPATNVSITSTNGTPTGCGSNTGTVTVNATGGTGTLTYLWSPGSYTTASRTGLAAGTYSVTVTDANGCTATSNATVAPPSGGPVIAIDSQKNLKCHGDVNGNAYTSATGGSGTYSYSWSNGTTGSSSSASIIGVGAGTYTITYTDVNSSCSNTKSVVITEPAAFAMAPVITNILCKGSKTGSINITPTGNNPGYTYDWSPVNKQTEDLSGLDVGTYTLSITDAQGCTATFSYSITQPASGVTASATATQTTCGANTGTATATGSGTGTVSYSWSTPPGGSTATISNLASGTYTVTVTDANACTSTSVATVGNANGPSTTLGASASPSCFGGNTGTATITITGGQSPYSYNWSNGTNGTTTGTSLNVTGLSAGTYTVTTKDQNNCSTTISVTITDPAQVVVNTTSTTATCGQTNGTATAALSTGGTGTLTYSWSTPPGGNGSSITNLSSGTYTVTVTDANGCSKTSTVNVGNASGPKAGFAPSATSGDSPLPVDFTNTSTGGTGNTYVWYFGDGSAPFTGTTPPTHTYTKDSTYKVCLVVTNSGCKDSTCSDIKVEGYKIVIPNVITPNGDLKNDVYIVTTKGVMKIDISIWDRWGLKIWEGIGATPDSKGNVATWDGRTSAGKECVDGTYYYMIKAYKFDGKTEDFQGFVTLVR